MKNRGGKSFLASVLAAIFAVTLILNLFSLPFAIAQEQEVQQKTTQEEKAPEGYKLETMTVTAEKREENIQEVPVAVSALSEIQIEDAGILCLSMTWPNRFRIYTLFQPAIGQVQGLSAVEL